MSMSDAFILETVGLSKQFRGFYAVRNIDLRVRRHSIHALIGPNGAGKTTCFNLISTFLKPTAGRIRFNGIDISNSDPATVALMGLVRSFQISAVFGHMTVLENVRIALQRKAGMSYTFWRPDSALKVLDGRANDLIEMFSLAPYADTPAEALSYGRKRVLELATTIALDPEMLLLDEPIAGLGHEDIAPVINIIRSVAKGRTILMVEHNMKVIAEL